MGEYNPSLFVVAVCTCLALAAASNANADDIQWEHGRWRLELAGYGGLDTSNNRRSDDFGLVGTVEHEWPLWERATLSIRLHPLFFYGQEQEDYRLFRRLRQEDNFNADYEDDNVWGAGFGPAIRIYQVKEERRGFFFEAGISVLFHKNQFIDNASNVNFMSEAGIGYKFRNDWHIAAKFRHISNAGFGDDNSATNGWGIGVGYSF